MAHRTLSLLAVTAALAGCTAPGGTAAFYDGIGNPHVAQVAQVTHSLDLATAGGGLAAGEADRAADWLSSIGFGYGDRVSIADGDGFASAGARGELARVVGRYGLVLADAAPVTTGAVPSGAVRLVVLRAEASVPGCPAWSATDALLSGDTHGFGCASAANLAQMVADPNDLLQGKSAPDTGSSAATATKAINALRAVAGTSNGGTVVKKESATSAGSSGSSGGGN